MARLCIVQKTRGEKVKYFIFILSSLVTIGFCRADLDQVIQDIHKIKSEKQKQIDPLLKKAEELKLQNETVKEELTLREKDTEQIHLQVENLQKEIKTNITIKDISDILLKDKKIGSCDVVAGKEANEFYLKDAMGWIRILFAEEPSSRVPEVRLVTVNNHELMEVVQKDFDPQNPNSTTGPMRALIRLDQQKRVVHAQFHGESIKDKGPFGLFGASLVPRGMTCENRDEVNLF